MGTPDSAVPSLERLLDDGHEIAAVWTQPDKPAGRGKQLHQSPVKQFALRHNLSIYQPPKIRTPEAKRLFASHDADIAVVVAYGKILPPEFLTAPGAGCINVHFSLLPKYRGAAPVNWTIVNGEQRTGVTTMQIVAELDAGPLLLQEATTIGPAETAPELLARLAETGARVIGKTLRHLTDIDPQSQNDSEATFAPMLKREDGLIDWSLDAFAIERRVRGFQPWPTAYTTVDSKRIIVWRAHPEENGNTELPGTVVEAQGDRLLISCGLSTSLQIAEVQAEGRRRMCTRDFVNGKYLDRGTILGS